MDRVSVLKFYLKFGKRTFQSLRETALVGFSDSKFLELIRAHPETLRYATITRFDPIGRRIIPDSPGMALVRPGS